MSLFLLIFDRDAKEAEVQQIDDPEEAMRRLFAAEKRLRTERRNLEIVLLTAQDEDDLRRTHSRYFETFDELLEPA